MKRNKHRKEILSIPNQDKYDYGYFKLGDDTHRLKVIKEEQLRQKKLALKRK